MHNCGAACSILILYLSSYIPGGSSKFGAFTIENKAGGESSLQYRLFINGEERWNTTIEAPPAVKKIGLGAMIKERLRF